MIRRTRRSGVTLMEVMIATAILSIGLLAILALFPIGAVSMARAINQNRAGDHASNTDATFRYYWKNAWIDTQNGGGLRPLDGYVLSAGPPVNYVNGARDIEPMITWLDSVNTGAGPPVRLIQTTAAQPSFIVLVDPIGIKTQSGNAAFNVGGYTPTSPLTTVGTTPIFLPTRTSLAAAEVDPLPRSRVRLTTMLDEFSYDRNGEPSALTGQLDRGGRYNVSWLIQRPKNNVPHEVNLQVLVFAGRAPTDAPSSESVFTAFATDYQDAVDPKPKAVTVNLNNQPKPPLIKGKWVAFTTAIVPPVPPGSGASAVPYASLDFYRLAAVQDIDDNTMSLEFEQPLRSYPSATLAGFVPANPPNPSVLNGYVVVFDNLFEVFDRGIVSAAALSGR